MGLHYIYNVPRGLVWQFQVEREPAPGGTYDWFVYQESVEADVATLLQRLAVRYAETGGSMISNVTFEVPTDVAIGSAFDVARPGGQRTALIDYLGSPVVSGNFHESILVGIDSVFAGIINIFKSVQVTTLAIIVFPDGSRVVVKFDALNNSIELVEGTEVDAAGNPIVDTPAELTRINFDFSRDPSGNSLERQLRHAGEMGVQIRVISPGVHFSCVTVGGVVTCTRTI